MRKLYVVLAFPDGLSSNLEHSGVLGIFGNFGLAYNNLKNSCVGRHGVNLLNYQTCLKYIKENDFVSFKDRETNQTYAQIWRYYLNVSWQKK